MVTGLRTVGGLLLISFIAFAAGCGSQKLVSGQKQMRRSFNQGQYKQAEQIADSLKKHKIYRANDRVLYALEMGTINYFDGQYEQSIQSFSNAEEYIDQFFTKSAKRGIKAFLVNDNELAYNGEVYEDVYINAFKSLAYLELDKYESAMVETRRIIQKLEQAESKYEGLAQQWSKVDTTKSKKIDWTAGTSRIHDSPMSHYLAGMLHAKRGNPDGARIELENLQSAIDNHQVLDDSRLEFDPAFKQITKPESYNVALTAFAGQAPEKISNNITIEDAVDGTDVKIAIPELKMIPSRVHHVKAVVNDTMTVDLPLIEEMDKVARETFKIKKPIIVARATVRGILKSATQEAVTDAVDDSEASDQVAQATGMLLNAARKASEKADLRGWQTMPGKIHTNVIELPPGKHTITFKYYSANDQVLFTKQRTVEMTRNEKLEPVTTIYPY